MARYPVERVDDAETLATFANQSLDFIVANHVLEHVTNFVGTLATFARTLRRGGVVFFALPDRRFCPEDERRPTTPPHHLLEDFVGGPAARGASYIEHVMEAIRSHPGHQPTSDERLRQRAQHLVATNASSGHHAHTFTTESLALTLARARTAGALPLALVVLRQVGNENIVVLRKAGGRCPSAVGGDGRRPTEGCAAAVDEPVRPDSCPSSPAELLRRSPPSDTRAHCYERPGEPRQNAQVDDGHGGPFKAVCWAALWMAVGFAGGRMRSPPQSRGM